MKVKSINSIIVTLFAFFYIVLPSYFAYEINTSLPLLTASRFFLLMFLVYYVFSRRGRILIKITNDRFLRNSLIIYFVLAIISNIAHLTETSESIKQIFVLIVEELMLIWLISRCVITKKQIVDFLRIMVYSSFVVAIISIVGSSIGKNYFSYLNTVTRTIGMANFSRLGVLRAEAGFGHAVYYSLYCAIMVPIIFYFIEEEKKVRYTIFLLVNLCALLFSNSRGSFLAVFIVVFFWFGKEWSNLLKKYFLFICLAFIGIFAGILIMPSTVARFAESIVSLFTALFGVGTISDNYGLNANGVYSRLFQFSGIYYVFVHSPLFGMGSKADGRGLIQYKNEHGWYITDTYDIGFVQVFCDFGIIGFIGYVTLYYCIYRTLRKIKRKDKLSKMFVYVFLTYLICYFSSIGVDKLFWVLVGLLISYVNLGDKKQII